MRKTWLYLLWFLTGIPVCLLSGLKAQALSPAPNRQADHYTFWDAVEKEQVGGHFDEVQPFSDGLAIVKRKGKYGLLNLEGKMSLGLDYDEIVVKNGVWLRSGTKWGMWNLNFSQRPKLEWDGIQSMKGNLYRVLSNGQYGVLGLDQLPVLAPAYDWVDNIYDENGRHTDLIEVKQGEMIGIADWCGNLLQGPRFQRLGKYSNGYAVVMADFKSGLIDLEANLVIPCIYENLYPPSHGLVPAKIQNHWGFIDLTGRVKIPFRYDAVGENGFFQGRVAVELNQKWLFLDRQGKEEMILEEEWFNLGEISEGRAAACRLNALGLPKYGFIDPEGKPHSDFVYDKAFPFQGGLAIVAQNAKQENTVVHPLRFGIVNRNGKEILPCEFTRFGQVRQKRDSLIKYGKIRYSSLKRNCALHISGKKSDCHPHLLDRLMAKYESVACANAPLIAVRKSGLWGFCNAKGKLVIPARYAKANCFTNGYALVSYGDKLPFYIDQTGHACLLTADEPPSSK